MSAAAVAPLFRRTHKLIAMTSETRPPPKLAPRSFGILFAVSIVVAVGNTGLMSILPAIGRQIQIPDPFMAAIFSLSALLWAVMSPVWARESDKRGRRPLIMLGLGVFAISMLCCGLVVTAGLHHLAPWPVIFVVFLLARALFGLIGSASNPATQAYVAERTPRSERTQMMASLAGAFGLGTVVGPFLAPMFILPVVSLAGPLFSFSLIALCMLIVVWRLLPEESVPRESRRLASAALWKDKRLSPFLIYGFLVAPRQTAPGPPPGLTIIAKPRR